MTESTERFQLVVVGSSAGGIEALSTLVSTLPPTFAAPLVIAQHLDPTRPSHLSTILTRFTPLPVITVQDTESLRQSTIYVVPANNHVHISDHDISLLPDGAGRPKPSIDLLFETAAAVFGAQLIAVILTGTGSDGTIGARAVKQAGGTVVIQNPTTAAYPGMPQSLAAQTVDIVADLERIGPILDDLLQGVAVPRQPDDEPDVQAFLTQVREQRHVDFRAYKSGTILRRLQRRIEATASGDLAGYQIYLQEHPEEYSRLVSSFLIKVTGFLRDPDLFTYIRAHVLPDLLATSQQRDHELRIWSAGCATGEEAYSLAILVDDLLDAVREPVSVKIFATDLDADAIAFARRGVYPAAALTHLPADLVARYFTEHDGQFAVNKPVRRLVVFGEHDLGQRAPFPRIDLVLCRNVLIYFTKELQQRALHLFAFALRDGGYLVLGKTETVNPLASFFKPEERQTKVYRRQGERPPIPLVTVTPSVPVVMQRTKLRQRQIAARELVAVQQQLQHLRSSKEHLLLQLPIGVVVVNRHYDIQEINQAARQLLAIYTPAIGEDFVHLAQHVSHRQLRTVIDRAIRDTTASTLDDVRIEHGVTGEPQYLQIACSPHALHDGAIDSALILVSDITALVRSRQTTEHALTEQTATLHTLQQTITDLQAENTTIRRSNAALCQTKATLEQAQRHAVELTAQHTQRMDRLVATNRELVTANEELTQINAELRTANTLTMVSNEEGQAAIEEVETLNEEMQATNEELETLNEELQATVEELSTANADLAVRSDELEHLTIELRTQQAQSDREALQLQAILSSMADAVVVVTAEGVPLLTNITYTQLFGNGPLTLADELGQPLAADTTPQARAVRGETFRMTFTQIQPDDQWRWFEAVGQPVDGTHGQRLGVVVIRDITDRSMRRFQEQFLTLASHELKTPLTVILGYLDQLTRWFTTHAEHERPQQYTAIALTQVHRLIRLVNDLLDSMQQHNDTFNLQCEPMRLDTLLTQTVEIAQGLTQTTTIRLTNAEEPLIVQGDAERLQQVVLNLLTNALTHAAESAYIDVCVQRVDQLAELTVRDYGRGIPTHHMPHLFSRFYQVSHAQRATGHGLGLGLFIAQQIVRAHSGTITVTSSEGEGTMFRVQIPLLEVAGATAL